MNDNASDSPRIHMEYMQYLDRKHGDASLKTHTFRQYTIFCKGFMFLCLGIAALIFSTDASARDIAYIPNEAGGQIVLTDIESTNGHLIAYSRAENGTTIFGYWAAGENFVIVKWDGGSLKMFQYSDFTIYEQDEQPAEPAAKSRWPKARL